MGSNQYWNNFAKHGVAYVPAWSGPHYRVRVRARFMLSREFPGSSPGVFKILFKPRLDRPTLDIEAGQVWDTAIFFKVHGQKHFDWLKSKFSEDSMW